MFAYIATAFGCWMLAVVGIGQQLIGEGGCQQYMGVVGCQQLMVAVDGNNTMITTQLMVSSWMLAVRWLAMYGNNTVDVDS